MTIIFRWASLFIRMNRNFALCALFLGGFFILAIKAHATPCGGLVPPLPNPIWALSGPNSGEITVYWSVAPPYVTRYSVVYGISRNNYIYGARDIGGSNARSFTIRLLQSKKRYYIRLAASRDCTEGALSSPLSAEINAVAR